MKHFYNGHPGQSQLEPHLAALAMSIAHWQKYGLKQADSVVLMLV